MTSSIIKSSDSVFSEISLGSVVTTIRLPNGVTMTPMQTTEKLRRILPCENLKHKVTTYKRCFKADDAIRIFQQNFPNEIVSDKAAIAFGRTLQRARILTHVVDANKAFRDGHYFYRLQCYQQPEVLNSYRIHEAPIQGDPMDMLDMMASLLLRVEQDAMKCGIIDYRLAHKSQYYCLLEDSLCQLQALDLGSLDELTRLAVVVDIYNVMMKYAFMKMGVPETSGTRSQFLAGLKVNVGGDILSFNDLYSGILRGNRPPHGEKSPPFAPKDPRARLALTKMDPRIHFAIHYSPLEREHAYIYPNTLHYDLQREAKRYLSNHSHFMMDSGNNVVHLDPIFKWYKADFGNSDWLILAQFLERNMEEGGKRTHMQSVIRGGKKPKISYLDADWGLRASNFFPFNPSSLKAQAKSLI